MQETIHPRESVVVSLTTLGKYTSKCQELPSMPVREADCILRAKLKVACQSKACSSKSTPTRSKTLVRALTSIKLTTHHSKK